MYEMRDKTYDLGSAGMGSVQNQLWSRAAAAVMRLDGSKISSLSNRSTVSNPVLQQKPLINTQ